VTSNPSEDYVGRVAGVFRNNGHGVRGDLWYVVKAILLDAEARNPSWILDPEHGKLREPFLRVTHVLRAFRHAVRPDIYPHLPYRFSVQFNENSLGQYPLSSPSVFNFYLPDFQPPGPVADAGLYAPEFQIHTAVYALATPTILYGILNNIYVGLSINLAEQEALASDPTALVDNVDLLLTHGTMSARTRANIISAVAQHVAPPWAPQTPVAANRARLAIYLTLLSPDYNIQK
jgi:hypothetical protein